MKQAIFAKWLLVITTTHLLLGAIIFSAPLLSLLQQGWWNTIGPNNLETALAFWFMLFSFPLFMLIYSMWGSKLRVFRGFLCFSLIGSVLIGVAIPFSGIWALTLLCLIGLITTSDKKLLS